MATGKRDHWVDCVKVFACLLVVLGHFFQSMVASNIMPNSSAYAWFNQTIYFFHVPLFFICSGYLYQKYSIVNSLRSWWRNTRKKAIALGIPYVVFSTVTWAMKTIFSSDVNIPIGGLFETLVLEPTSPYWYLYALFFCFLITPTFANKTMTAMGIVIALLFKMLSIFGKSGELYAVQTVLSNEIWFVLGMCISAIAFDEKAKSKNYFSAGCIMAVIFMSLSILVFCKNVSFMGINFLMGLLACAAVVLMGSFLEVSNWNTIFDFWSRYTMPIYLMHTIFAAPVRIVLLKLEVQGVGIHILLGLTISVLGPIIASEIMKRIKWMEFFLYPSKYIRVK